MRLVFFDIDGTLLPEGKKEISKNVLQKIKEIDKTNTEILICTGRCFNQAKKYIKDIDTTSYITSNGQEVCYKGKKIYQHYFSTDEVEQVTNACSDSKLLWAYESRIGLKVLEEFKALNLAEKIQGYGFVNVEYVKTVEKDIFQFWLFGKKEELDGFQTKMGNKFNCYRWNDICLEVMPLNQSKGNGILILQNYLNKETTTFAFGDGVNDIEMLDVADYSFAMENGVDKVKEIAKFRCGLCEKDGLIKGLEILEGIR